MAFDKITEQVLGVIDTEGFKEEGAYNLRYMQRYLPTLPSDSLSPIFT